MDFNDESATTTIWINIITMYKMGGLDNDIVAVIVLKEILELGRDHALDQHVSVRRCIN